MGSTAWVRAWDDRREDAVAALRERALDGSLTLDDFASAVGAVYREPSVASPGRRGRVRSALARLFRRPPAIELKVPRQTEALLVGRSRDCDVVVGEETVSPFHAELRHGGGDSWTVHDLGSAHGTWLNGSRVREARVARGDVLRLGGLRLDLRL